MYCGRNSERKTDRQRSRRTYSWHYKLFFPFFLGGGVYCLLVPSNSVLIVDQAGIPMGNVNPPGSSLSTRLLVSWRYNIIFCLGKRIAWQKHPRPGPTLPDQQEITKLLLQQCNSYKLSGPILYSTRWTIWELNHLTTHSKNRHLILRNRKKSCFWQCKTSDGKQGQKNEVKILLLQWNTPGAAHLRFPTQA